jgi:hypothetical protein
MLVAYLRGYLPPGYPNGFKSMLRETMILQYLSLELEQASIRDSVLTQAPFVSVVEKPAEFTSGLLKTLHESYGKLAGWHTMEGKATDARVEAIKLFVDWVKTGKFGPSVADELGIKL